MKKHDPLAFTPDEYRDARLVLRLSRRQLAAELGTTLKTITRREETRMETKRESALAMRWLLANPPDPATTPKADPALEPTSHRKGDRYGLFTILDVFASKKVRTYRRPVFLRVQCSCGRVKNLRATSLTPSFVCWRQCSAHKEMVDRGSHVDHIGDIVDKDGFPEF